MKLNVYDFATFIAVARHNSFRAAGDELGLSPSAVSHAIKQLEQRLKIRLFNRTTRSVSLTEAGARMFERLRPAFDEINMVLDEANCYRQTPMGVLKINASRLASRLVLIPLVTGFSQRYPDIRVEITTEDRLVDIVKEGFDAGIRLSSTLEKDMIALPVGPKVKLVVAASPDYFARHPRPTHPREIDVHPCVMFRHRSGRIYQWEFNGPDGQFALLPGGNIILDDMDSQLDAVLQGAGLGYLYYEQVKDHLANGSLISVVEDWLPERPSLQFYYPNRQYMSSALRTFIDYIKAAPLSTFSR
ncbi:LysR family transcriptional regulator [Pantoea sp. JZ2]|uniref:LysR family transcriptional regulator n=1 Tax=Pantoea sp. JZ2 TaxID=2654189 RepID=UPI002B46EE82|nr:LysR substrate-binding domain-containing protein [Pantoea sp. JZ2]WRH12256.1 LysR family transcriptional regulator [Pantoea sp. JZ2]